MYLISNSTAKGLNHESSAISSKSQEATAASSHKIETTPFGSSMSVMKSSSSSFSSSSTYKSTSFTHNGLNFLKLESMIPANYEKNNYIGNVTLPAPKHFEQKNYVANVTLPSPK